MMQFSRQMRLRGMFHLPAMFFCLFLAFLCAPAAMGWAEGAEGQNSLRSIEVEGGAFLPVVKVLAEKPIGYRYTVYDSYDPVRVVIDLPGMDVSAIQSSVKTDSGPLQEIRTGSFDLASGRLGRIELLLSREAKYKISSEDKLFSISFIDSAAEGTTPAAGDGGDNSVLSSNTENQQKIVSAPAAAAAAKAAHIINSVQVGQEQIVLATDGTVENYQFFHLRSPPRLVVDVYGVKAGFPNRKFQIAEGFQQLRVGTYEEKIRFVLDAGGKDFPEHNVAKNENGIVISWGKNTSVDKPIPAAAATPATKPEIKPATEQLLASSPVLPEPSGETTAGSEKASKAPLEKVAPPTRKEVNVQAVDFKVENLQSILTVALSAPAEISGPDKEGRIVRFAILKAKIGRPLRRSIDASAFPSAVKLVTPYSAEGGEEVRFAVELKGDVPYALRQEDGKVLLIVDNERFAEPKALSENMVVPIPAAPLARVPVLPIAVKESVAAPVVKTQSAEAKQAMQPPRAPETSRMTEPSAAEFSGEKISLVFDDANIRNILQLIGEVSNLNIIASEDVKGTITLRLIDVPWDQALNLILETKGLGMLREGNVVRILPKDQIRAMRQAELTAVKEERQLESVITEVIPVSYTALNNITTPAKELLTDRGKITEDARNKQIIITDIPSVIESVKKLAVILDTPERQVMIEARIVEASSSFGRDLGVKWGLSYKPSSSGYGDISNANIGLGGSFLIAPPSAGSVMQGAGLGSGITFGRVGIDSTVLDLRISALESSGYGKVISTPRVSTLNGGTASISQGTKIPYQSSGADGLPKTEFVDANLQLTVQPVINPDDSIILDISATNSSIGSTVSTGGGTAPAIDTKEAKTKVLVRNGETTVIGGIFVESENASQAGVPWLSKAPIIGHLFRSEQQEQSALRTPCIHHAAYSPIAWLALPPTAERTGQKPVLSLFRAACGIIDRLLSSFNQRECNV